MRAHGTSMAPSPRAREGDPSEPAQQGRVQAPQARAGGGPSPGRPRRRGSRPRCPGRRPGCRAPARARTTGRRWRRGRPRPHQGSPGVALREQRLREHLAGDREGQADAEADQGGGRAARVLRAEGAPLEQHRRDRRGEAGEGDGRRQGDEERELEGPVLGRDHGLALAGRGRGREFRQEDRRRRPKR